MPKHMIVFTHSMKAVTHLTAFLSGFVIMSLEILGFRVLAPHFGYSIYVFGTLIGLILFALAIGYWVGGYISRVNIRPKGFALVLVAATAYIAAASTLFDQVVLFFSNFGIVAGAFMGTFALWAFPMMVLAAVSPYLIGLRSEKEHAGRSAGGISAAGTLGGLAGTFLTSFFLLPTLGTHMTFVANAYIAAAMTAIWLLAYNRGWLIAVLVAPILAHSIQAPEQMPNIVHAEESAYSHIEVVNRGSMLVLRTDRRSGTAYSAIMRDGSLPPFLLYNLFAVPAAAKNSARGLLLGVGAGTLPLIHEALNPDLKLVGLEIDPRIIAVGERFFGLKDRKNLEKIVIADARPFLAKDTSIYDVIEMDIFRESEIPFYLVSREFFVATKKRLADGGVFMMNIYDPTADRRIQRSVTNTVAAVYPEVYVVPTGLGSYFVAASRLPLIVPQPQNGEGDTRLNDLITKFREGAQRVVFSPGETVFTDDRAPIETLYIAPFKEIL